MLAVGVGVTLDDKDGLQMIFILSTTHHFIAASSPVSQFVYVPFCKTVYELSLNCFSVKPSTIQTVSFDFPPMCSSILCFLGSASFLIYRRMFTEYFPIMMNTLLKVLKAPPPLLFYPPFHCTLCQKHPHLLLSVLLLRFDILISAFLPASSASLCASHLGIYCFLPHSLSV